MGGSSLHQLFVHVGGANSTPDNMATKRQLFFCLQILLVKLIIVVVVMVNQAYYVSSLANMFDSFDDTVHFAVLWPGRDGHDRGRDGVIKENLKDDQKVDYTCLHNVYWLYTGECGRFHVLALF